MEIPGLEKDQTLLSRFSLIEALGEGGMGQVWLVRDTELKVDVAIKVLNPQLAISPARVELLKNECRNARRLVHPNIVRIFDFHRSDELAFISMEYIEGEDLDAYRRRLGILSYDDVVTRLLPVIAALSYAHEMGLVHRDLKAGNVLLDRKGTPRVADFGISGVLQAQGDALNMSSGGSLYSMSPQQLGGHKPHPSDDIYALGILMYELLTGHPPFYPDISPEKIHRESPPTVNEQLERMNAGLRIPDSLNRVIVKLMAKFPDERPSGLKEIHDTLENVSNSTSFKTMPPAPPARVPIGESSSRADVEVIIPEKVYGRDEGEYQTRPRSPYILKALLLIFALIVLLVGGGLLLYYLSKNSVQVADFTDGSVKSKPGTEKLKIETPGREVAPASIETTNPAQIATGKGEAEKKMTDFLSAKKIETVMRLIESGKGYEQKNDLSFALTDYREALRLDPQSKRALTAFNRVKTMIANDQFQRLMSSGFSALNNENHEAARTAFLKARSFKPNSNEVQDALAQVDQAIRLAQIEALRKKALAAEKMEDWDRALESYLAALEVDNTIQFAVRGKEHSQERIRIEKYMKFYLEKPGVLEFDRHLENALLLLQEGSQIEPKGPRLTGQIEKLDQLVKIAKTPVRITLESDNLTEVAVYKMGRLGSFYTRDLDLRPGTYTVVGTRDGYKDVRQKMVVKAGEKSLRLTIKCEERI